MSKKAAVSLPERKSFPPPLGDRGSSTSNINEPQIPRSDSIRRRRRRRNPFSDGRRNNFPDIDDVFKSTTTSSSGLICEDTGVDDFGENEFDDDNDDEEEFGQHSDIGGCSVLNMSIGARAALNEHARYVAKFGIDGEKNMEAEMNDNSNTYVDEINSETCSSALLDDQWERILDLSRVASSIGGSISDGIPSPPNSTTINVYFESSSTEKSKLEESASIEVMTDVSHDFFNSSRVNLLITPERNRNRRTEVVITRDKIGDDDIHIDSQLGSTFGNEQENSGYQNETYKEESFLDIDSNGGQQLGNGTDLQGSSFNLGDISRISTNTVSDTNCTPDASFPSDHKQETRLGVDDNTSKNDEGGFTFTNIFGTSSRSVILNDSFLSDPKNRIMSIEDASPEKSVHSSSSIQSAVSTFIAEARSFAKQVASDVEKSIEGMESLPAQFFRGIDIGQSDAPSPISQGFSSPSSSRQGSTRRLRGFSKSLAIDISDSSSIDTNTRYKTTRSLAPSAGGDALHIHLTGRKRYRTVVPRRVYLDLPTQESNEEQDSFVAVRSNPEMSRGDRSLLESFEEAATSKTY